MASTIIVSYDGTDNDRDALALGRLLEPAGAALALAYVRHSVEEQPGRERLAQHDAEQLLRAGADWLGEPEVPRHVVMSVSTPEGLRELALREGAELVVFGSEYRTAPGHVVPQASAQRLLDGGPLAIGLAPVGLAARDGARIATIAAVTEEGDASAEETAEALAGPLGAELVTTAGTPVDLLVIGSRRGASSGRVMISAAAAYLIETVRSSILVVPRNRPLRLHAPVG
jgi:nucleotide-binding universal stress UspA family protein